MSFKIAEAIIALEKDKPFYAHVCMHLSRVENKKLDAPLGFKPTNKGLELHYNPDLVELHTVNSLRYQLEHIVFHLVSTHPIRREGREKEDWDTATDLVVSQVVPFHQTGLEVATVQGLKLPKNQPAEQYYDLIQQSNNNNRQPNNDEGDQNSGNENDGNSGDENANPGSKGIDSHALWDEDNAPEKLTEAMIKGAIEGAIKHCGSIPGELSDLIAGLFEQGRVDWKTLLSQFLANSQITTKKPTWQRPHRRFVHQSPGYKKKVFPKVLIGVDTSGSVSDVEQKMLLTEVREAYNTHAAEIIVAGYDCRVHTIKHITSESDIYEIPNTNGGTDFQPLNDLIDDLQPDAVINLTDGGAPTPSPIDRPYCWIFTPNHQDHPDYGESIVLTEEDVNDFKQR